MIQILLVVIGAVLALKKEIDLSKKRVLRRPHSIIAGVVIILSALFVLPILPTTNELYDITFYILIIVIVLLLSKKKV